MIPDLSAEGGREESGEKRVLRVLLVLQVLQVLVVLRG